MLSAILEQSFRGHIAARKIREEEEEEDFRLQATQE